MVDMLVQFGSGEMSCCTDILISLFICPKCYVRTSDLAVVLLALYVTPS